MPDREELRAYAEDLILNHASDVEYLTILEMAEDRFPLDENGEHFSDEDAQVVDDLINKAEVTVTWVDEREHELEYKLESRVKRLVGGVLEAEFGEWRDASGYNNKNGGVYTSLGQVKAQKTRDQRYTDYGWEIEHRVFKRLAVRAPWQEAEIGG